MKKKILIVLLTLGVIYYFKESIKYWLVALYLTMSSIGMPSPDNDPDYDKVNQEMLDTNENLGMDTILDIDMECGGSDDPKMWIGIEGDTIWK